MSIFYHVVIDSNGKWIKSPNNGGECCTTQEDTVETLNKLIQERDALQARVTTLQVLWDQRWKMMRELEVVCGTEDVEKAVEYIKGLKARVKRLEEALVAELKNAELRYEQEQRDGDGISIASTRARFIALRDACGILQAKESNP